ncbi:hypothetical protein GCM10010431_72460 [Streptomyces kunmingensis]
MTPRLSTVTQKDHRSSQGQTPLQAHRPSAEGVRWSAPALTGRDHYPQATRRPHRRRGGGRRSRAGGADRLLRNSEQGTPDCLDTGPWQRLYKKTGKPYPMPSARVERYVTKVQAEKRGESWKIVDVKVSGTSC